MMVVCIGVVMVVVAVAIEVVMVVVGVVVVASQTVSSATRAPHWRTEMK